MLTDEERKALVINKVKRSRETWLETRGIIENKYWYAAARSHPERGMACVLPSRARFLVQPQYKTTVFF